MGVIIGVENGGRVCLYIGGATWDLKGAFQHTEHGKEFSHWHVAMPAYAYTYRRSQWLRSRSDLLKYTKALPGAVSVQMTAGWVSHIPFGGRFFTCMVNSMPAFFLGKVKNRSLRIKSDHYLCPTAHIRFRLNFIASLDHLSRIL